MRRLMAASAAANNRPVQVARPAAAERAEGHRLPADLSRSRWLVLAVVLAAVFMQLLDTTIVTVAIPSIQSDLSASFASVQLVLAGYSLAFACALITASRLGDIHGRKRLFLIGMTGFTLASALCGAAPGAGTLVGARFAQGLFSALMFPQVLAIVQVVFPTAERPKALALYGATIGLATILGPVSGGALINLDIAGIGWRSIFYVNVPIGLVALLAGLRTIPESSAPDRPRLDVAGALTVTTGLFLLVLPLVIGREQHWPAWTLAMLAASVPVLAGFFRYEALRTRRPDAHPLLRTTLFRARSFRFGLLASVIFFAGLPSFFFVFILTLQVGFGYSAVAAGAVTLGFAGLVAVASARSAHVVRRLGSRVLVVGCALLTLGMAGVIGTLHELGDAVHGYWLLPSLMVAGAGAGLFLAPVTGVVLAGVRAVDAGAASGVLATAQQIGAAIGIAVIGVVFFGLLGTNATSSSAAATPRLRSDLAATGLPNPAVQQVVAAFRTCFDDRAHETDPSAVPASCRAAEQQVANSAAPARVKAAVSTAVLDRAIPQARKRDFSRSLQVALGWQLGMFAISLVLVSRLPRIDAAELPSLAASGAA